MIPPLKRVCPYFSAWPRSRQRPISSNQSTSSSPQKTFEYCFNCHLHHRKEWIHQSSTPALLFSCRSNLKMEHSFPPPSLAPFLRFKKEYFRGFFHSFCLSLETDLMESEQGNLTCGRRLNPRCTCPCKTSWTARTCGPPDPWSFAVLMLSVAGSVSSTWNDWCGIEWKCQVWCALRLTPSRREWAAGEAPTRREPIRRRPGRSWASRRGRGAWRRCQSIPPRPASRRTERFPVARLQNKQTIMRNQTRMTPRWAVQSSANRIDVIVRLNKDDYETTNIDAGLCIFMCGNSFWPCIVLANFTLKRAIRDSNESKMNISFACLVCH